MKLSTGISLAIMMFLQYYIWGAWYVTMGPYMDLAFAGQNVDVAKGAVYGAGAIATIISPFFVGMIADRYFAAQKLMGILHLIGAGLLFYATTMTLTSGFYWVILIYSLLYMPTIALSNSVAFAQMSDPGKQFPWIRVFGTLGWIVAGLVISQLEITDKPMTFQIAAGCSALLGVFSFLLPNTPPKANAEKMSWGAIFGADAFVLFKSRAYTIFFIAAILICIPLSFYYGFAGSYLKEFFGEATPGKMAMGQMSEALFIIAIPFLFYRIGVKNMLILGMSAWVLRYVCFAYGGASNHALLYAGIILHGICYDFFFVTGYMYTEKKAGEKIKNAAQSLFTFATYGVGMFIGTNYSGFVSNKYATKTIDPITNTEVVGHIWETIWLYPAVIAGFVLLAFIIFFKEKKEIAAEV
ncbi:MAG: nucleoside permease [Sediminibacterium sp.]|nr:nucleoside permease [Sediminibacterium sp.]